MSAAGPTALDQVTFSVMLRRLQSISLEMTQALERSAWKLDHRPLPRLLLRHL